MQNLVLLKNLNSHFYKIIFMIIDFFLNIFLKKLNYLNFKKYMILSRFFKNKINRCFKDNK